jgi:opine dehydrogenase
MLMNPTKIEAESKTFALYKDGFSPSVWAVVAKLDSEKMNVLESIGAKPRTYWDEFKLRTFGYTNMDSLQAFFHYANEAPGGPYTMNHRYLTEDVPKGLGMLQVLGRICKVSTPICDSLINIADSMLPGAGMKDMINMNAIKVRSCYEYFVRSDEVFGNILGS